MFSCRLNCLKQCIFTELKRNYHTQRQQIKAMQKLLNKDTRKKKLYMSDSTVTFMPKAKDLAETSGENSKVGRRRVTVLNKLFMKHITDQMSTGTISDMVYGRSIEISKIKVAADFTVVNIYWYSGGTSEDVETENILKKVGGMLRHELSQLRIIGVVPKIAFIKDGSHAKLMEVDEKLAVADFGEEFEPTDPSFFLKTEFMLNSKLHPKIKEQIKELEKDDLVDEIPLPPMRSVVFGLDRDYILSQILKQSKLQVSEGPSAYGFQGTSASITSVQENREQFRTFLKQRKIELKRQRKALKYEIEEKSAIDEYSEEPEECENFYSNEEYDDYNQDEDIIMLNDIAKK